jgi:hypothetical protein
VIRARSRRTLIVLSSLRLLASLHRRACCAIALLTSLSSAGCSGPTYVALDGAALDATRPPDGSLELLSAQSVAIRPGEIAPIDVRCTLPGGAACAFVEVTFAIEGAPLDSTLSALSARTDSDGRASGGIVAGTQATSFRVRVVSRAAALPIYVDVGVGTSFGTLVVRAPYSGSRIVTHRVIDVVPRALCADLASSPPEVGARALPDGSDELSIAGLPTTVRYAVLARAQSDTALTASGCVDDVQLEVDGTTTVDVPYVDAPLAIEGRYTAELDMDATLAADAAFDALGRTLLGAAEARGGDALAMLDAVEHEISVRGSTTAADAFASARTAESLDATLGERLVVDGSTPTTVLVHWVDAARISMGHARFDATLALASPGATLVTDRVTVADAADGTIVLVPSALDPTMGLARPVTVSADGSHDVVHFERLPLDAPLGAMLLAWLDAVATSDGLAGTGDLLAPACGTLRDFVSETAAASACDADCVDAACATIVAAQLDDLVTVAAALDVTAGGLTVSGALAATDADGDVRVDALSGTVTGAYLDGTSATLGPVSGSIVVTRAAPAP